MATLKMCTNDGNNIWLPNVKRVEQMYFFSKDLIPQDSYPWEIVQEQMPKIKLENPNLHCIIEQRVTSHENFSAPNRVSDGQRLLLLYVVLDAGDDVRPQNWLVFAGQNYLLENGKTIDRI
jgi:hypothetical protein